MLETPSQRYGSCCLQCRKDKELLRESQCIETQISTRRGSYIIGRCDSNAILERMPAHVQYLLVEIYLVRVCLFSHPTSLDPSASSRTARSGSALLAPWAVCRACCRVDGRRYAHLLCLKGRLVRLKYDFHFSLWVRGVDHKVVVVAASHNILCISREDHFKFIENTIIFVGVAETRSEMLMDWYGFDRRPLHIDIPNLDGQVIAGQDVSTIMRESDVGYGGDNLGEEGAG